VLIAASRREFFTATAAGAAALLACRDAAERPSGSTAQPPNIVFIMADDLGYGELGCYGQSKIRTPNIDRIAAEGMRFSNAYSGCSVCAPARSVLMTGMHMGHTSVRSNPGGVPILAEDVTVAELLKERGYATGCFGKWGLGDIGTEGVPWKQGFDEFVGYLHQAHAHYFYPHYIFDNDRKLPLDGNEDGGRGTYSHDVIADRALEFIEKNKDQPFFCYVPFTIPHAEYVVPDDEIYAQYAGRFEEVELAENRNRPKRLIRPPEPHATLAAMITRMDRDVGRILQLIDELGLDENTIVFFTSDNGAAAATWTDYFRSSGDLRGAKRDFYEGGIRVPLAEGPILMRHAYELLPFENFVTVLSLSGEELERLADEIALTTGEPIAGWTMELDGDDAVNVRVGGDPVDPGRIYRLTTVDYLVNGGGNWTVLWEAGADARQDLPVLVRDVFVDYVRERGTVSPTLDGRIRRVGGGRR